ncbi:hypothetical protein LCGC14_0323930 [marine sediment metagenome]|uniref:Glycosyltransferase 2-like domain-containing protein n=1 Tax=marine sediment metagenome TaxID=412755 RepID=A0A0F9U140_9ZZZZ|nr:glycosyltransferase family A protein [Halomonas sp.]HEB04756.1 glycosyltransferase family 2 protein [Halomonas sp.]
MPLVSVIIPTHDRARYAVPSIKSLLALSENIEVVVCDTSEVDAIAPHFSDFSSRDRLRLIRPNRPMSVVDNFNEALKAASGDYLVFIGDDDFVTSEIINVAKWARSESVDSIKFTFPVHYYWSDFEHWREGDSIAGTLRISSFDGSIRRHDAKLALKHALNNFGGGVLDMPRAYAGMVSADLVRRIQAKHGVLFGGVSPDIYSAALISLETKKCVKIDFPVIVPGSSRASTAGQSASGGHVGGLRENSHIGAFKKLIWDEKIPEFYSVPTVWSYSLLKAVAKEDELQSYINFPRLYLKCVLYHRAYIKKTLSSLLCYMRGRSLLRLLVSFGGAFCSEVFHIFPKLIGLINPKLRAHNRAIILGGQADSQQASIRVESWIEVQSVSINYESGEL